MLSAEVLVWKKLGGIILDLSWWRRKTKPKKETNLKFDLSKHWLKTASGELTLLFPYRERLWAHLKGFLHFWHKWLPKPTKECADRSQHITIRKIWIFCIETVSPTFFSTSKTKIFFDVKKSRSDFDIFSKSQLFQKNPL